MDDREVRRVVTEYSSMIKRISYNYLKQPFDCDDICQTVFMKLITGDFEFKSSEHEKAWLVRTTINACKDFRKSAFFSKTVGLEELGDKVAPAPEKSEILEEIKRLPGNYRVAIYLHYYEGYSTEEIADMMGKRKTSVSKYLARGKKILRETLANDYGIQ